MKEHITRDYVVTQSRENGKTEIWLDWIPAVDSNPHSGVEASIEDGDLLITPSNDAHTDKKARRVVGLREDVIAEMHNGLVLKLCGPSGVLAEHQINIRDLK